METIKPKHMIVLETLQNMPVEITQSYIGNSLHLAFYVKPHVNEYGLISKMTQQLLPVYENSYKLFDSLGVIDLGNSKLFYFRSILLQTEPCQKVK